MSSNSKYYILHVESVQSKVSSMQNVIIIHDSEEAKCADMFILLIMSTTTCIHSCLYSHEQVTRAY